MRGTLQAVDPDGRLITFTDWVYEGDTVDVFASFEDAEWERGPSRLMRVERDNEEWLLALAALERAVKEQP